MLSQSLRAVTPARFEGIAATTSFPVEASIAETTRRSESSAPEQKLFTPWSTRSDPTRARVVRASRGLRAFPQNHRRSTVSSARGSNRSRPPKRRTVARSKCWKPNTCASEPSAHAIARIACRMVDQEAPWPPSSRGIERVSRPLALNASLSAFGVPPRRSRSAAVAAKSRASFAAMARGSRGSVTSGVERAVLIVAERRQCTTCATSSARGFREIAAPGLLPWKQSCAPAASPAAAAHMA